MLVDPTGSGLLNYKGSKQAERWHARPLALLPEDGLGENRRVAYRYLTMREGSDGGSPVLLDRRFCCGWNVNLEN
jgi:hypothetical protein